MSMVKKIKIKLQGSVKRSLIVLCATVGVIASSNFSFYQVEAATSTVTVSAKAVEVIRKASPNLKTSAKPVEHIQIWINGKNHVLTDPILMENERVFLPVRNLATLLGAKIDYEPTHKVAVAQNNNSYLELPIGYNKAVKNKDIVLDIDNSNSSTKSLSFKDRTYLPVRFLVENLGFKVTYDNNVVSITTDGSTPITPDTPPIPTPKPSTPPKPETVTPSKDTQLPTSPPTYKGKKTFERSKDNKWGWDGSSNTWVAVDPAQDKPQTDVGPIILEGPNGNWN